MNRIESNQKAGHKTVPLGCTSNTANKKKTGGNDGSKEIIGTK
jgi:hypothetical protein